MSKYNQEGSVGYSEVLNRYAKAREENYEGVVGTKGDSEEEFKINFCFRVFRLDNIIEVGIYQDIMTKILSKESSYVLMGEDPYWDKTGVYLVAVRWVELF